MGAQENRNKSQKTAEFMKAKGVKRTTGACPWGCGAQVPLGGPPLMDHLNRCQGGGKKRFGQAGKRNNRRGKR